MLLNLTNHPSSDWAEKQYNHAIELYKEVVDLQFPQINPNATSDEVELLVEDYENRIRKINPMAVHLMGELVFTFRLVKKLQKIGMACVASTTKRNTIENNGLKTSVFEFVQFREF